MNKLLLAVVVLFLLVGVSGWFIVSNAMKEIVTPLRTLNPTSSGPRVLVIYSPGLSDFHQKITEGFAASLVDSGWSVDIVTASSQTLTDLSNYSLLVIGGPIRGGEPPKQLQDYMERVSSLEGLRVYTLISSLGGRPQGEQIMSNWISSRGGVEEGILSLTTMTTNTPVDGVSEPVQIAAKVAQNIQK